MTGFFEDQALRFEGLDDADIASLDAIIPDLAELDTVLAAQMPRINRVVPVLVKLAAKILAKQKELS